MAARFLVTGGNGNWTSTTNWSATDGGASGASAPVLGDIVTLNNNSGATNITLDTSARACTTLTITSGYTGTMTFTNDLSVSGSVTLGANMGFAGAGALIIAATGTMTSSGKTLPQPLQINAGTQTFADNWTTTGGVTFANANITVNGFTLNIAGTLTVNVVGTAIVGTTNIVMNGTGNITMPAATTGSFRNNLEINTAGTITLLGTFRYGTGIFKYTAGTVVTTGATLTIVLASTTLTINAPLTLETLTPAAVGTFTINGTANLTVGSYNETVQGVNTVLQSGRTYTITSSFIALAPVASPGSFSSSTPSSSAFLKFTGSTMAVVEQNATDIDSSGGNPIYSYGATLLRTSNWITGTNIANRLAPLANLSGGFQN